MTSSDFVTAFKSVKDAYKPDILTCLANLSNDEVFTPPSLASEMLDLLPQSLFSDPNTKFLDPASKSGVFLREIARRLMKGLEKVIPDEQKRRDHIFTKQIFGIAITELTAQMSRRSLYCSKTANGKYSVCKEFVNSEGNVKFDNIKHTFVDHKCKFCGVTDKVDVYTRDDSLESYAYQFIHTNNPKEIFNMKFDVIIGNPPYQLNVGVQQESYAIPLYHKFVQQAKKLKPRYLTMIIPSRWFAGGRGLDDFREEMLHDDRLRVIHDYVNASDCFSGVEIKGGVCYFLWDRDNRGLCKIYTHKNGEVNFSERKLLEEGNDTFIRYNQAINIMKKVSSLGEKPFSDIVSSQTPFGLYSSFKDFRKVGDSSYIKVYANKQTGYLDKSFVIEKNSQWINKWKIYVPKAVGVGDMQTDVLKPIIGEPNSICTQTYILFGPFENKEICNNVITYINTKFFHFLMGLKKVTQDAMAKVYTLIPMQDFSKPWKDDELYKKYKLSKEEIEFIESMVNPTVGK